MAEMGGPGAVGESAACDQVSVLRAEEPAAKGAAANHQEVVGPPGKGVGLEIPSALWQKRTQRRAEDGPGLQIIVGVRYEGEAVLATRSWPLQRASGLQSRSCNPALPQHAGATATWRDCLAASGYSTGCVIGRSQLNHGFSVISVTKGERTFAAKLTDEGVDEGILRSTLKREHAVLSRLHHRGIVSAVALVEAAGGCGMVMERCSGVQLTSLLPSGSVLCCKGRHAVVERILDAVSYLHAQHVAHTDLHAANVMVSCPAASRTGGPAAAPEVKIIDFGSARDTAAEGGDLAAGLDSHISPGIRPPESARGVLNPCACDVFEVGLLAAGLVVGRSLTTGAVVKRGTLAIPEGFLRLTATGRAHMAAMLSPLPEKRPEARTCLASLPPSCGWWVADA